MRTPLLFLALLLSSALATLTRADPPASGQAAGLERALRQGCRNRTGSELFVSPRAPQPDQPLRLIAVSERPAPGATLAAMGPTGRIPLEVQRGGGPPHFWVARLARPSAGTLRFALVGQDGTPLACARRRVERRRPEPLPSAESQWPHRRSWNRLSENLYAVWIEALFDAPEGQQVGWTPLHQVIRDPTRNLLYNHLGAEEDGPEERLAVVVKPDCADMPYFLRAYFAWKLGLPLGWRHCDRGSSTRPTRCGPLKSNLGLPAQGTSLAARFSRFLRAHVSLVHSGSGRTAPDDDESDLYPVPLSRATLRPGTVYVDPYGHLLVVAKWVPQTGARGGLLYAVDGHPDLSVGRKRFWRGAFLFSDQITGGAGGFKAFRPLRRRGAAIEALTNAEIKTSGEFSPPSSEQYRLGLEGFYDRMDRLITPRPLAPTQAYRERLEALFELLLERVGSVQAGEDHTRKTGSAVIPMPKGPRIFETQGPWEDFSTPARDLRLLIAIEEVARFPGKVAAHPERFAIPAGQEAKVTQRNLEDIYRAFVAAKTITYLRSDGSPWKLTMAEIISRRQGLEMAYNPNDCAEIRWAARGEELKTCTRHAPASQRQLMERYRSWFATRTRPPLR